MALTKDLYESTVEVLTELGEQTMRAVVWQLSMKGVPMTPEKFDIKLFSFYLTDLFGDGANALLYEIYQNFMSRLSIDSVDDFDHLTVLQIIEKILELEGLD